MPKGKLVWIVPKLLEDHARLDVKRLDPLEPALARRSFLETLDERFPSTVRALDLEVMTWSVQVEDSFVASASKGDPVPLLLERATLLLRGLVCAHKVRNLQTKARAPSKAAWC